jgi:[ribosomal protein S18]-alanine N-acetyltransferase
MSVIEIRPLRQEDLAAVVAIEHQVAPLGWNLKNFTDSLAQHHSCWVSCQQQQITGYAILTLVADEASLLNLAIAPAWQRRGVGRELLRHTIAIARERHASELFLEVRASNQAAINLYETIGFNQIGRRRHYYPLPAGHPHGREDALLYALTLL